MYPVARSSCRLRLLGLWFPFSHSCCSLPPPRPAPRSPARPITCKYLAEPEFRMHLTKAWKCFPHQNCPAAKRFAVVSHKASISSRRGRATLLPWERHAAVPRRGPWAPGPCSCPAATPVSVTRGVHRQFYIPTRESDPEAESQPAPSHPTPAGWLLRSALSVLAQACFHRAVFKYHNVLSELTPPPRPTESKSALCSEKFFCFFFSFLSPFSGFSVLDGVQLGLALKPLKFLRACRGGGRTKEEGLCKRREGSSGEKYCRISSPFPQRAAVPWKLGTSQRRGNCAPKRTSAPRNGAWVWVRTHERVCPVWWVVGAGRPASQRVFQGQLELPVGSGCDITGQRKTLGPEFL